MLNLFLFLISIVVFYIGKSHVFNNDDTITISRVYGGSSRGRYVVIYIILLVVGIISSIIFGYLTYQSVMNVLNSL